MSDQESVWKVEFYKTARGDSPPREYVDSLNDEDRAKIARFLGLLRDLGTAISMPYAKHLTGDLWELRPHPHRLLYVAVQGRRFYILHAFRKVSDKTKPRDVDLALSRMRDLSERLK